MQTLNIIIEKILHNRLTNFFELNKILNPKQYGFRKGISTQDGINELVSNIYNSFENNKHTGAVFLDLSKAFNAVSQDILLKNLNTMELGDSHLCYYRPISLTRIICVSR